MKKIRLFSFSLIVLCLAIFLLGSSSLFQVDEIVVQGNQKLSLEDIKQKLESFQGKNLLLINLNEVAFKLAADKRIATVEVSRSWPDRITVNLSEKKPVLLLRTSPIWGLTPTGEVLPVDPSDSLLLPWVDGIGRRNFRPYSHPVIPELRQVLELYWAAQGASNELLGLISDIEINSRNDLTLTLANSSTKVYLGRSNYKQKLGRLIEILGSEQNLASSIDLRFENLGLVRYANRQEI